MKTVLSNNMTSRLFSGFVWTLLVGSVVIIFIISGIYRDKLKPSFSLPLMKKYQYDANKTNVPQENTSVKNMKPVLILVWSTFFGSAVGCNTRSSLCNPTLLSKYCKSVPCVITTDRSRVADASVITVHSRDPQPLPPKQYSDIPLVLFGKENPVYTRVLYDKTYLSHFTYSMNYRPDTADFFLPTFDRPSIEPKPIPFTNKTGLIVAVFSNCETGRTAYLRELMKHIQVDSYGACLRNKKTLKDRYVSDFMKAKVKLLRNYKFTIVFHNQDCDYWVDTQLTHALNAGSVPVFMGTDKVHELLGGNLNNSIIKVKDFAIPKKLAEYLLMVSKNETLYNGYLKWKYEGFQFPPSFLRTPQGQAWQLDPNLIDQWNYCKICETIAVTKAKGMMKKKGLIKPIYCRPRQIADWLKSA